jgi:hypothetical protein
LRSAKVGNLFHSAKTIFEKFSLKKTRQLPDYQITINLFSIPAKPAGRSSVLRSAKVENLFKTTKSIFEKLFQK